MAECLPRPRRACPRRDWRSSFLRDRVRSSLRKHTTKQDHRATQVEHAQVIRSAMLPSRCDSSHSLQPSEQALNFPSALVTTECATVLLAPARAQTPSLRRDQFDVAFFGETISQRFAVPCLVRDQSRRQFFHESRIERSVGEHTVVSGSIINIDSEWKAIAVCNCHDLCRIAGAAPADARSFFLAGI